MFTQILRAVKVQDVTSMNIFYKDTYPDTQDASGNSLCHVGRLRLDPTCPKTLSLWLVGDQLLKGAASNIRQIFELKLKYSL